jgi:hypothetical protein
MFDYPTVEAIAGFVLPMMLPAAAPGRPAQPRPGGHEPAPMAADSIAALTDDEIASLLLERGGGA